MSYLQTDDMRTAFAGQIASAATGLHESNLVIDEDADPASLRHLVFSVVLEEQENTRTYRDQSGYGCRVRSRVRVTFLHRVRPNATGDQVTDYGTALQVRDDIVSQAMSRTGAWQQNCKVQYVGSDAPKLVANGAFLLLASRFLVDHTLQLEA